MNTPPGVPADAHPIKEKVRTQILAPFLTGIETTLREAAMTELSVYASYRLVTRQFRGEIVALIDLSSTAQTCLALGFGIATATALAQRALADTVSNPNAELIRDCLGELVNVAAGQAKALLHGTPWHFTFGTPRIASEADLPLEEPRQCVVAILATEVGEVFAQLFLSDPCHQQ